MYSKGELYVEVRLLDVFTRALAFALPDFSFAWPDYPTLPSTHLLRVPTMLIPLLLVLLGWPIPSKADEQFQIRYKRYADRICQNLVQDSRYMSVGECHSYDEGHLAFEYQTMRHVGNKEDWMQ